MHRIEKRDGKRYRVEYADNGHGEFAIGEEQILTLREKITLLRSAFSPDSIGYADRFTWVHMYPYHPGYPGEYEAMDTCPDSISYGDTHNMRRENTRIFIDLSDIGKGEDTAGQADSVQRSNFRTLREAFPGQFTAVSYSNVDCLGAYVGNLTPYAIETLISLRTQYAVYDEDDLSQLEHDEVYESYEYAMPDVVDHLSDEHRDMWDALSDVILPAYTRNEVTIEERAAQPDLFWDAYLQNGGNNYAEHQGLEIVWNEKAMAKALADALDTYFSANEENINQGTLFSMAEAE